MLKIPEKNLFILLNAINAQALVERCDKIVDFEKDEELVRKTKEYKMSVPTLFDLLEAETN